MTRLLAQATGHQAGKALFCPNFTQNKARFASQTLGGQENYSEFDRRKFNTICRFNLH